MAKGWYRESRRHSLAARGVRTARNDLSPKLMEIRRRVEEKRPQTTIPMNKLDFKTISERDDYYVEKYTQDLGEFRTLVATTRVVTILGRDPYGVSSDLYVTRQIGKKPDDSIITNVYLAEVATFKNRQAAMRYAARQQTIMKEMIPTIIEKNTAR